MKRRKLRCYLCNGILIKMRSAETGETALGEKFEYFNFVHSCQDCGEQFCDEDWDTRFEEAKKKANEKNVKTIVKMLEGKYSLATIERILEIPIGTMGKWASGELTDESILILRILSFFPDIIKLLEIKGGFYV